MKKLSFLGMAAFVGLSFTSGCIVTSDDDSTTDANASTGGTAASSTGHDDHDHTTSGGSTTDTPGTTTDAPGTTTDAADSSSGEPPADSSGDSSGDPPPANCGWNADESFYACGNMGGEDPSGTFPLGCPEGLVEGMPCDESGLTGEGCCDADGNNWYCTMDMTAFMEAC